MTVNVPKLFLMVHWVGLQSVVVVFPDHTYLFSHEQTGLAATESAVFKSCML